MVVRIAMAIVVIVVPAMARVRAFSA